MERRLTYKGLCLAFLFFVLAHGTWSQSYDFGHFSVEDGLSQSQVSSVTQDAAGRMWFGTVGGGVCRFDGKKVRIYRKSDGLVGNSIQFTAYDSVSHNLYIGTARGEITLYNGSSLRDITPKVGGRPVGITGMQPDGKGHLLITSIESGLWKYDPKSDLMWPVPNSPSKLTALEVRADGRPLVSDKEGHVYQVEGERFERLATVPGDTGGYIFCLMTKDDYLYVGTGGGIYLYKDERWQSMGPKVEVNSLEYTSDGELWGGTRVGAIRYMDGGWETIGKASGLADLPVNSIYEDREGNVWLATGGAGVFLYRGGRFMHYGEAQGLSQEVVMSMGEGPGGTWIGTSTGLFLFDGKEIAPHPTLPLPNRYVSTILPDTEGGVWVLCRGQGLVHYRKEGIAFYSMRNGLPDNYLTTGYIDSTGTLWMGAESGLIRREADGFTVYAPEGRDYKILWGITPYREGLLCGFAGGLLYFDGRKFHELPGGDLLKGKVVLGMVAGRDGRLFCNVYNEGLYVLSPSSGEGHFLNTASGLTSNLIYSMLEDGDYLYLGTERGIDRLSFDAKRLLDEVRNYGPGEGFKGMETNRNAVLKDSLGRIWFGNIKGIALYDPSKDMGDRPDPILTLSGVRLFYEVPDWQPYADSVDMWYNVPYDPVFPYNQNHLVFDFFGSTFVSPERLRYRYRLEGFDNRWSPPVETGQAMYANLPPGKYTLKVEAVDDASRSLGQALAYSFVIEPPIWGRWWFMVLLLVAAFLLIKIISDNRVRVKLEKAMLVERIKTTEMSRLRKELARDFHDEIGNHFASISVLVQMLSSRLQDNHEMKGITDKLQQLSRSLYLGGRDFIWSIDPENEQVGEMVLYIKDFGEELFENTPITFRSHLPDNGSLSDLKLPAGGNRQVIMIGKEAMTNALKHSKGRTVSYTVRLEGKHLYLTIKDDGIGMPEGSNGHRRGLNNMKKRAERVGGSLSYLSNGKEGLSIVLVLTVEPI